MESRLRRLKLSLPRVSMSIGYPNDALIVAKGTTMNEVQERANVALDIVSEYICSLGLCLAIDKT